MVDAHIESQPLDLPGGLNIIKPETTTDDLQIGIVVSRYNQALTGQLLQGAVAALAERGLCMQNITIVWVPGSDETPPAVEALAQKTTMGAVIALGAVIEGETAHADIIAGQVSNSLARISSTTGTPAINGIVTARTAEQAVNRCFTDKKNRGHDFAMAAVDMALTLRAIRND